MTGCLRFIGLAISIIGAGAALAQVPEQQFPVEPILFVDEPFKSCEGISFNGEGRLFVTCNKAFWEIELSGKVRRISDMETNLGIAAIGESDLLVADFGPTNAFRDGRNSDGIIWRMSPSGKKIEAASGIGD